MTQNSEHTEAIQDQFESLELSDDELSALNQEIESEVKFHAELLERQDAEIFVVLNEFTEMFNRSLDMFHSTRGIKQKTKDGKFKYEFVSVIEAALERKEDPFAHDFFCVPYQMYFRSDLPNSKTFRTIGGERMMPFSLRVNAENNKVIVQFMLEPSESISMAEISLDFTRHYLTRQFASGDVSNALPSTRAKWAILEFLMRFFVAEDENLDGEDFEEIIKNNDIDSASINPTVQAIVEVQHIIDKYQEKANRMKFSKLYADQGIEPW